MIACDLGSNTFRVVQMDCQSLERVLEFERIVKTAEGIALSGEISPAAIARVLDAIEASKSVFDYRHHSVKAVATAALRRAKNASEVLEILWQKGGIAFEVIDGEEEAKYTRLGVENRLLKLGLECESYLLLDLGGGSCEVILKHKGQIEIRSFEVGIVTIVEKYGLEEITKGIQNELQQMRVFAKSLSFRPKYFIGASGTPTTIASFLKGICYEKYDYQKINGFCLTTSKIKTALSDLLALTPKERAYWVGVGRDDLIIAGVVLVLEIMTIFGFESLLVIDDGLREGVAIAGCKADLFSKDQQ